VFERERDPLLVGFTGLGELEGLDGMWVHDIGVDLMGLERVPDRGGKGCSRGIGRD